MADPGEQQTVLIRGEAGAIIEMALPLHETIAEKLAKGVLTVVEPDDGSAIPDGVPGLPTERPPVNAPKSDWIAWAVASGAVIDDAEAMTKTDLIDRYGQPQET